LSIEGLGIDQGNLEAAGFEGQGKGCARYAGPGYNDIKVALNGTISHG